MTKVKDVITIKMPFPTIDSNLATYPHMYLCIQEGLTKELLSCQTKKPMLLLKNRPPYEYVDEQDDINRNPFNKPTLIGCDYSFCLENVRVSSKLLASNRRDICDDAFSNVQEKVKHSKYHKKMVEKSILMELNPLLTEYT